MTGPAEFCVRCGAVQDPGARSCFACGHDPYAEPAPGRRPRLQTVRRARKKDPGTPPPPPAPPPADPAGLLGDLMTWVAGYVSFPSEAAAAAVTLWIAHTHLADAFESTPRLALLSPERECGKTRTLELLGLTCAGAELLNDASPAFIFRRIGSGAGPCTLLLDEADAIWKRGKADESAEALRSILNSGHRKGASVGRVEMNGQGARLVRFPVYCPAAIAGIGSLPDTVLSRAIVVRMRRRAPGETVRDYRERITGPEGEALRGRLAAWAGAVKDRVGDPWPFMPDGVTDRAADCWEPLIAVADLAGADWPGRAREACTALLNSARDDSESAGIRLLADIRAVWPSGGVSGTSGTSGTPLASDVPHVPLVPHMGTDDLLGKLHALPESPWADCDGKPLDARGLARALRPYGITPDKVRIGAASVRGYRRDDLADSWRRYLTPTGGSATSATPLASGVADVADVAHTPPDDAGELPLTGPEDDPGRQAGAAQKGTTP